MWVWTLDFSRIFGAQELVSLVHLLEDVLHENKRERVQTIMVQTIMEVRSGGRVGLVVGALAFNQCGPGSISALGVICGLSLLVLYSAMRGFPSGTPVFPSHQKLTFDLI